MPQEVRRPGPISHRSNWSSCATLLLRSLCPPFARCWRRAPETLEVYPFGGQDLKRARDARFQFIAELTEFMGSHDWPMARVSFTPLAEMFVPVD
jgi:hypothetical protein